MATRSKRKRQETTSSSASNEEKVPEPSTSQQNEGNQEKISEVFNFKVNLWEGVKEIHTLEFETQTMNIAFQTLKQPIIFTIMKRIRALDVNTGLTFYKSKSPHTSFSYTNKIHNPFNDSLSSKNVRNGDKIFARFEKKTLVDEVPSRMIVEDEKCVQKIFLVNPSMSVKALKYQIFISFSEDEDVILACEQILLFEDEELSDQHLLFDFDLPFDALLKLGRKKVKEDNKCCGNCQVKVKKIEPCIDSPESRFLPKNVSIEDLKLKMCFLTGKPAQVFHFVWSLERSLEKYKYSGWTRYHDAFKGDINIPHEILYENFVREIILSPNILHFIVYQYTV